MSIGFPRKNTKIIKNPAFLRETFPGPLPAARRFLDRQGARMLHFPYLHPFAGIQEDLTMTALSPSTISVHDIEVFANDLDVARAAALYKEHGCLVVRGLMKPYLPAISRDIEVSAAQAIALLDQAK